MPSAKRRIDRGPVSREVMDRHNQHKKETYWDIKAKQARERQNQKPRHIYGDPDLVEW